MSAGMRMGHHQVRRSLSLRPVLSFGVGAGKCEAIAELESERYRYACGSFGSRPRNHERYTVQKPFAGRDYLGPGKGLPVSGRTG